MNNGSFCAVLTERVDEVDLSGFEIQRSGHDQAGADGWPSDDRTA